MLNCRTHTQVNPAFFFLIDRSVENDHDEETEKLKNSFEQKVILGYNLLNIEIVQAHC